MRHAPMDHLALEWKKSCPQAARAPWQPIPTIRDHPKHAAVGMSAPAKMRTRWQLSPTTTDHLELAARPTDLAVAGPAYLQNPSRCTTVSDRKIRLPYQSVLKYAQSGSLSL